MATTKESDEKADLKAAGDGQLTLRERRLRRRRLTLLLACGNVLFVGIVVGLFLVTRVEPAAEEPPPPAPISVLHALVKGEELQRTGHPDRAWELYQLAARSATAASSSLTYRMGVCAQQLGKLELALELYESTSRHESEEIAAAARLALAKLQSHQRSLDSSAKTLSSMAALSSKPIFDSTLLGTEVQYVFALVQAAEVLDGRLPGPLDSDHFFNVEIPFKLDQALRMVPREGNQLQLQLRENAAVDFGVHVHGPASDPATTLLSANLDNRPISVLLDLLAAATSWRISPTELAREIVVAKSTEVHVRDKTAGELLTLVLAPQRLSWTFEGGTLVIDSRDNSPQELVKMRAKTRAVALLQSALAESPDHALAPQAYVALGNLAAFDARFERAATFYGETTERFPRHRAAQIAHFNLAKIRYQTDDLPSAIESFYQVVDLRLGTQLEPLAYLYLGRIHFDQGQLKRAKQELSRGLALATQPDFEAAGSMTLAAVYLIEDEAGAARSANAILFEHRRSLDSPRFRNEAVFLSALTRFRTALRPADVRRRGRELLAAAMKVDPTQFFGDFGYLLVGDAFADINLTDDAVNRYQEGVGRPLADSMRYRLMFRLATEYRKQNETDLAKALFQELTASGSVDWAPRAAIELATLLFRANAYRECIEHCRRALEQGFGEGENIALLRQLGLVYEELGDHEQAGLCFAGFLPSRPPIVTEARR